MNKLEELSKEISYALRHARGNMSWKWGKTVLHISPITNESEHYRLTVTQAMNDPNIFRSAGLKVDNAYKDERF